jgi:hypothetical protein
MIKTFHDDMEGMAAGLGMSNHADVIGARRFRYHGSDPLLFETFGRGEYPKQVPHVQVKERDKKIFKSREATYTENKEAFEKILSAIDGDSLKIDVGFDKIESMHLNHIMKEAVDRGVKKFFLDNVMGQRTLGTGIHCEEITVRGLVGNHSFAFLRDVKVNVIPNHSTITTVPANAQVGVANTSNPAEINIAGDVSDLFAAYSVSGTFRVAKSGGVRNLLLMKAGLPEEWKNLNVDRFQDAPKDEILKELVKKYQQRRAKRALANWQDFLKQFEPKLMKRKAPVAVYGLGHEKGMGDYFMEYAQGGIGIILNIVNRMDPIGYYVCSGMTAGAAYIRGRVTDSQLGKGVRKIEYLTPDDKEFLAGHIKDFIAQFKDVEIDKAYNASLNEFAKNFEANPEQILADFCKIIPISSLSAKSNE